MKWLNGLLVLLLVLLLVPGLLFSSDGSQVVLTKTEWEQIQMLSKELTMDSQMLQTQLNMSQVELTEAKNQLKDLQIRAELLMTSYEQSKQDNKKLEHTNNMLRLVEYITIACMTGLTAYLLAR